MNSYRVMGFTTIMLIWIMAMTAMTAIYVKSGANVVLVIAGVTSVILGSIAYIQDRQLKKIWDD